MPTEDKNGNLHGDNSGKFVSKGANDESKTKGYNSQDRDGNIFRNARSAAKKKMTPAEKIASVHIDFDRDNILPELNENALKQMGAETSKKVLLKKSVIEKNRRDHVDISDKDMATIIAHALYDEESDIFRANPNNPNYYHFASFYDFERNGKRHKGVALLDIDDRKENFEIVHAHLMRERSLTTAKKK